METIREILTAASKPKTLIHYISCNDGRQLLKEKKAEKAGNDSLLPTCLHEVFTRVPVLDLI